MKFCKDKFSFKTRHMRNTIKHTSVPPAFLAATTHTVIYKTPVLLRCSVAKRSSTAAASHRL